MLTVFPGLARNYKLPGGDWGGGGLKQKPTANLPRAGATSCDYTNASHTYGTFRYQMLKVLRFALSSRTSRLQGPHAVGFAQSSPGQRRMPLNILHTSDSVPIKAWINCPRLCRPRLLSLRPCQPLCRRVAASRGQPVSPWLAPGHNVDVVQTCCRSSGHFSIQ